MKKIFVLIAILFCIPALHSNAWDIESYFGIKIGMPKKQVLAQMQKWVDNANKYRKVNCLDDTTTWTIKKNNYSDMYFITAFGGYSFGESNCLSMLYPMASFDTIMFFNNINITFKSNVLKSLFITINAYAKPDQKLLSADEIANRFSGTNYQNYKDINNSDDDGDFEAISFKKINANDCQVISAYDVRESSDPESDLMCRKYNFTLFRLNKGQ